MFATKNAFSDTDSKHAARSKGEISQTQNTEDVIDDTYTKT